MHVHQTFMLQAFALVFSERELGGDGNPGFSVLSFHFKHTTVHDARTPFTEFRGQKEQKAIILLDDVDDGRQFRSFLVFRVRDGHSMIYLGIDRVIYVVVEMEQQEIARHPLTHAPLANGDELKW
jgi:hypothetical protein